MHFRIAAALGAIVLATPASAQEVPVGAQMDLWCGTAFQVMTADPPATATPEQQAAAKVYADAGQRLVDRAVPVYLESGYTDDALGDLRSTIGTAVKAGLSGTAGAEKPAYSFEDCSSLIDQGKDGQ
jgi:hypothetical protein